MTLYRGMDRSALDAAYNNRAAVPTFPATSAQRAAISNEVRARRRLHADLRYGAGARERLDFFPADKPNAPVFVFIHGGYWQASDKESHSFLAEGPLARGFAVALIEYTLAPEATMDQIVGEIDRAMAWLRAHVAELGGDPQRLFVSGHSAGGHLTAMMLGRHPMAGALPISGLFDLKPIGLCYLNDLLRLDAAMAARNSPQLHLPTQCPPIVVTVGAAELPELYRQSEEYAAALDAMDAPVQWLPLEGHEHFSILSEIERPDGLLCEALVRLAEST
jgi:acetyl esterase/lipase